ncbi:hypothetical protein ACFLR9_01150 [Bacteroidota bacterium]
MNKMIVDCFTFFNELDLLEIRLKYLYDSVDYFIIVEADKTHNGEDKNYFLKDNMDRYKSFQDKMIYVPIKIEDYDKEEYVAGETDAWKREIYQRNSIEIGLRELNLKPNDLILISDLDEIPNKLILKNLKKGKSIVRRKISIKSLEILIYALKLIFKKQSKRRKYAIRIKLFYYTKIKRYSDPVIFRMSFFYYYLNYKKINGFWPGMVCVEASLFKIFKPDDVRNFRKLPLKYINNGGWHFSYLGGIEAIKYKLKNFAHQEFNNPDIVNDEYIQFCIKNGSSLFDYYENKSKTREYDTYEITEFPEDMRTIVAAYQHLLIRETRLE